ncbi:uncharacterized protein LY89DRAFT_634822 [Mollisia scopiformis]|uniref:Peptidase S33 tripeptidyl aminopeptidase-like C-terminal domain-containing protein n=1 Tax=Mollisia scopiformis TaxID=149040 RepID=A0A194XX19_MOLSC|nr:uncharacterized protein LY89DRAFT_634822 [Mollisia scopiformis]KUJ24614.1 hypothetical protein LY89DRAFT_634822 [Mollisia scopiformis]
MEKSGIDVSNQTPRRGLRTPTRMHISLLLSLAFLSWIVYQRYPTEVQYGHQYGHVVKFTDAERPAEEFAWTKITPTKHLEYTPCYGKFECARLDVPMDYNSTASDASRVAVAIIRYPAPVPLIHPQYGGPILLNPGGPGGSGVNLALSWAETISKIVNPPLNSSAYGSTDAKFFDIVSWDPRGVNNTTPHVECFPDNFSHDVFKLQMESEGFGSIEAKSNMWARSNALSSGCSENASEIIHHMNTATVVADMVEIIERHGEWRSKQTEIWVDTPSWKQSTAELHCDHPFARKPILERTRYRKGEEKLQYWGFSYGTLLGATFSALQPHRVGRVIIDGVCDSTDYYKTGWLSNLRDTDKIMDKFYSYCSTGGNEKCPLNTGSLSPEEIQAVVENIVSSVKDDPISVPGTASRGPDIITYSDVMNLIKDVVYTPLKLFPIQATLLTDVAYGNGSAFADYKAKHHEPSCPLNNCEKGAQPCVVPTERVGVGILCSDGESIQDWTKKDWFDRVETLVGQSKWMGEYWSSITMNCASWKGRPKWSVKPEDITGNTSHPILLIGNTLDPVTPLYNAFLMQKKFPGSGVLTQDSEGHCTLASPSLCTVKAIRNYFQTGALPAPGTVCQPEELPLLGKVSRDISTLSEVDRELLRIIEGIKDLDGPRFF